MDNTQQISGAHRLTERLHTLFAADFCPGANRYVYWIKHPLALLLLASMGGAALGAMVAVQGWYVCAATLTIAAVGTAWPWLGMKGIQASLRVCQPRCQENEPVTVEITISNRWPWPVWGLRLSRGFGPFGVEEEKLDFALAAVPAWSRGNYRWEIQPALRGEYPREEVRVSTSFPFGVYEISLPVAVENRLIVHPRTATIVPLESRSGKRWSMNAHDTQSLGRDGEVLGTRPFRQGDSLRDVHWSLTARYDRWIVCERQSLKAEAVRVVLDTDPTIHVGEGANASLEWGLRFSASICESLTRFQSQATLVLGNHRLSPALSGSTRANWCAALARWCPTAGSWQAEAAILPSLKMNEFFITTDLRWRKIHCLPACRVIVLRTSSHPLDFAPWLTVELEPQESAADTWLRFTSAWEERGRYAQRIGA